MAESRKPKRASQHGSQTNLSRSQKTARGTRGVALFKIVIPKRGGEPPLKGFGNVTYQVQSEIEPVTFKKRKDAVAFQKLLLASEHKYQSDIVRREITKDGYYL